MTATDDQIRATVHRYVEYVATGTTDQVLSLYADGATVEDPVGTDVRTTRESIAEFYGTLEGMEQAGRVLELRIAGGQAAFLFELVTTVGEQKLTMSVIDVMTFDDAGLITSMRAFWSNDDMVWS